MAEKGNTVLRNLQGWPLVIIILAIIILVGWKRLPDAARSVGRSMRIFKSEVEQMTNKDDDEKPSAASTDTVDGHAGARPMTNDADASPQNDRAPQSDTSPHHGTTPHHDTAPRGDDRPA